MDSDGRRKGFQTQRQWMERTRVHPNHGFSLFEIIIVLMVIGLAVAFTFPKFQNLLRGDMKSVSRKMIGTVQFLYDEALTKKKIYRLNYDLSEQQYWASYLQKTTDQTWTEVPVGPKKDLPTGVTLEDVVVLHAGKVNEGKSFTEFYPIGEIERSILHLRDHRGDALTLEFNSLTGGVRVYEGYREIEEG